MPKVVPFIAPETLRRLESPATYHDAHCRCRVCKPPLVGEQSLEWTRRFEIGLVFAIVIVGALLVAAAL